MKRAVEFAPQSLIKYFDDYNHINFAFHSIEEGKLLTLSAFQEMIEFDR